MKKNRFITVFAKDSYSKHKKRKIIDKILSLYDREYLIDHNISSIIRINDQNIFFCVGDYSSNSESFFSTKL